MEGDGKRRAANWSNGEELILIEEVNRREPTLFGKIKGCGAAGKVSKLKENGWQEVVDILNSQFITKKREINEVKKKYHNIKQRSKEKLDQVKRPKTGGGPTATYTDAEDLLLNTMEGRPQIAGLPFGIDTDDDLMIGLLSEPALPFTTTLPIEVVFEDDKATGAEVLNTPAPTPTPKRHKVSKESKLTTLEEENIKLDNERLKLQIEKIKEERENLKLKNEILHLKLSKLKV